MFVGIALSLIRGLRGRKSPGELDNLLKEDGENLLMENGFYLLLE